MRSIAILTFALLCSTASATAAPADDFAYAISGPWGRVTLSWQPLLGALSKNSCPPGGITRKESVGLFGEGGAMWIEPSAGGSLNVYDGGPVARPFLFIQMDGASAAIYGEAGVERRLTRIAPDRLTQDRVPAVSGLPATNFVRCTVKKK